MAQPALGNGGEPARGGEDARRLLDRGRSTNYETFCPYLVGSTAGLRPRLAQLLRDRLHHDDPRVPPSHRGDQHIAVAFDGRRACGTVTGKLAPAVGDRRQAGSAGRPGRARHGRASGYLRRARGALEPARRLIPEARLVRGDRVSAASCRSRAGTSSPMLGALKADCAYIAGRHSRARRRAWSRSRRSEEPRDDPCLARAAGRASSTTGPRRSHERAGTDSTAAAPNGLARLAAADLGPAVRRSRSRAGTASTTWRRSCSPRAPPASRRAL